jgi:hypothetical protein
MPVTTCPLCKSSNLELVLDLGLHPLADTFVKDQKEAQSLERFPLQVLLCTACGHAMNSVVVPKEKRYQEHEYSYDSANSKAAVNHFDEMAKEVAAFAHVTKDDLVVDIGGNVGTLLQAFNAHTGARMLNVEPAHNIAAIAKSNGVETIEGFWDAASAQTIAAQGGAKAITITNAFNHIDTLDECMASVVKALTPDGVFVPEVPYLLTLLEREAFDTVYLEHVSYFAVRPLRAFFARFGLSILDVVHNDYMGGSIRFIVGKGPESPKVADYIAKEEQVGLFKPETYTAFRERVAACKERVVKEITDAKAAGGRIVGLGAATKGNTLLNYCGIDSSMLEFVTDTSPLKIGKYTPGSAIPIKPDEAITEEVTHALILPWNIADLLTGKLAPKFPHLVFITPHM